MFTLSNRPSCKKQIGTFIASMLLVLALLPLSGVSPTIPVHATSSATLGIWSDVYKTRSILDSSLASGQSMTVEINVTNIHVPRFNGFDITIRYNPAILNATSVSLAGGLFAPSQGSFCPSPPVRDNVNGLVEYACALLGTYMTDVQTGMVFSVQFEIIAEGSSPIDINETASHLTENVAYTPLDGFFSNQPGSRNIAVTSVSASAPNELAVRGDIVTINVTVANQGDQDEQVTVQAYANSTQIEANKTSTVSAHDRSTLGFLWNTTNLATGVYRLRGVASTTIPDLFSNDNSLDIELVTVAIRDLAVDNLRIQRDTVSVNATWEGFLNATVQNRGTVQETANITVSYNGTIFGKTSLVLAPGQQRLVQFDWNTTGVAPGVYVLTLNVTVLRGELNTSDNSASSGPVTVFGTLLHDLEVVSVGRVGLSNVVIGSNVTFQVTIRNNGPYNETFQANLYLGQELLKTWTGLEVRTFASLTLELTWSTTGLQPGNYAPMANVSFPGDQVLFNNEKTGVMLSFAENQPPVPNLTFLPTVLVVGQLTQFNATGSYDADGKIVSYTWNFGDGTLGQQGKTLVHTYATPGRYFVRLTVTDDLGKSASRTETVSVSPAQSQPPSDQATSSLPILVGIAAALAAAGAAILFVRTRRRRNS